MTDTPKQEPGAGTKRPADGDGGWRGTRDAGWYSHGTIRHDDADRREADPGGPWGYLVVVPDREEHPPLDGVGS